MSLNLKERNKAFIQGFMWPLGLLAFISIVCFFSFRFFGPAGPLVSVGFLLVLGFCVLSGCINVSLREQQVRRFGYQPERELNNDAPKSGTGLR